MRLFPRLNAQNEARELGENFPPEQNFTVTSGVTYTTGVQGPLKADVYVPRGTGPGPFPGIVFIHGGGWKNGDRHQMIKLIKALAEAGYVGFTIDYDVAPAQFPVAFKESLAAVSFFRAHAAEYYLDPARIAVAGSSAGGELAAVGADFDSSAAQMAANAVIPSRVQAALILNGVLDLTAEDADLAKAAADYLGAPCASRMHDCKNASPLFHVHRGAPPFYVGHGTMDQVVPFEQAVAFTDALKEARVPVEFFKAEGAKHTYWADPHFYGDNLQGMTKFLKEHLGSRR
jgi:acetyl esterase/lipase